MNRESRLSRAHFSASPDRLPGFSGGFTPEARQRHGLFSAASVQPGVLTRRPDMHKFLMHLNDLISHMHSFHRRHHRTGIPRLHGTEPLRVDAALKVAPELFPADRAKLLAKRPFFRVIHQHPDVAAVFLHHDRPEIGALLNGETLPLSGSAGAIAHRTILRERGGSRSAAGRQQSQQQKFSHSSPNKEISEEELPQGRPRSRNRPRRLLLSSTPISYFDFS